MQLYEPTTIVGNRVPNQVWRNVLNPKTNNKLCITLAFSAYIELMIFSLLTTFKNLKKKINGRKKLLRWRLPISGTIIVGIRTIMTRVRI